MVRTKPTTTVSLPPIQPVAAPPPKAAQVNPPRPVPKYTDQLAPLSATLAKIAGHHNAEKKKKQDPLDAAEGSLAFDAADTEELAAAIRENHNEARQLIKLGFSHLAAPAAIESYNRDSGYRLASEAKMLAERDSAQLISAIDGHGRPRQQGDPRQHFLESARELDEFAASLGPDALAAYDQRKTSYMESFADEIGGRQTKARESQNLQLKTDRYTGVLNDLIDRTDDWDEADLSVLTEMTNRDWFEQFPWAREALMAALGNAIGHAKAGDRHARGHNFIDAMREVEINGIKLDADDSFGTFFEAEDDKIHEAESMNESQKQTNTNARIAAMQREVRQEHGEALRDLKGNPRALDAYVGQLREDLKGDPSMSEFSEEIGDYIAAVAQGHYSDPTPADPGRTARLQDLISRGDPYVRDKINASGLPEETVSALLLEAETATSEQPFKQGQPAWVGLESATQLSLDPSAFSTTRRRELEDLQRGIERARTAMFSKAINDGKTMGGPTSQQLEEAAVEIADKLRPQIQQIEDQARVAQAEAEKSITDRMVKHVDAAEQIHEAYETGAIDESSRNQLLTKNSLATDLETVFFTNSNTYARELGKLMSKVEVADVPRLAEILGAEDAFITGAAPPNASLLKSYMEGRLREEGYAWLDENLEATDAGAQPRAWKDALLEINKDFDQRLFSKVTLSEGEEAKTIVDGKEAKADDFADLNTEMSNHVLEVAMPKVEFARAYQPSIGEDASKPALAVPWQSPVMAQFTDEASIVRAKTFENAENWKSQTRSFTPAIQSYVAGQTSYYLTDLAAFETAARIVENEDLTEGTRTAALQDIAMSWSLSPSAILAGETTLRAPGAIQHDFNRAKRIGILPKDVWYGAGPKDSVADFHRLTEGTGIRESMDAFYGQSIKVPLKVEDISPFRHLVWHSDAHLTRQLKAQPERVAEVLNALGIPESHHYAAIEAQRALINKIHTRETE